MTIGVDTGASTTRIWDGEHEIIRARTPSDYFAYVTFLCEQLKPFLPISALVVSLPVVIESRTIVKAPNLAENWKGKRLAEDLPRQLPGLDKVLVIEDTEAAGYAVQSEELDGLEPTLFLTLSTGVGGALVLRRMVLPLEVGHMPLNLSGRHARCGCGQIGCTESDLSGTAVFQRTGIPAKFMLDKRFWKQYGKELGQFLLVIVSLFKFRQIILGGGVSQKSALFLPEAEKYLRARLKNLGVPIIRLSSLGDAVGVHGAYWLADKLG